MKWEYLQIITDLVESPEKPGYIRLINGSIPESSEEMFGFLDQIGAEGWELISAFSHQMEKPYPELKQMLYFKRPTQA